MQQLISVAVSAILVNVLSIVHQTSKAMEAGLNLTNLVEPCTNTNVLCTNNLLQGPDDDLHDPRSETVARFRLASNLEGGMIKLPH